MWFGLAVGFAGCGGDGGGTVTPDPDMGPVGTPVTLDAFSLEAPVVFAYRDEGGSWQDIPPNDESRYVLRVHGAYEVLLVCGDASYYSTQLLYGVPVDGGQQMYCLTGTSASPQRTRVMGTMVQPGRVTIGSGADESATGPWMFEIDATSGEPADLIAHDADRVEVRRNIDLSAAIAEVDLTSGLDFAKNPVIVDGREGDDAMSTETYAYTEHGSMVLRRPGSTIATLPAQLLEMNDFQYSFVMAETSTTQRDHLVIGEARVELLPRLTGITFEAAGVTWTALPDAGDEFALAMWGTTSSANISSTHGWREGRTRMAVPTDLPANVPAAAIPASASRSASLSENDGRRTTRLFENAPTPREVSVGEARLRANLRKAKLRD
jgi:hypothetical protein